MATHSSILAGKFHGQRSLAGYSPRGCKELDTTEHTLSILKETFTLLPTQEFCEQVYFPKDALRTLEEYQEGGRDAGIEVSCERDRSSPTHFPPLPSSAKQHGREDPKIPKGLRLCDEASRA